MLTFIIRVVYNKDIISELHIFSVSSIETY